jgi:signal transduction histidine kinase
MFFTRDLASETAGEAWGLLEQLPQVYAKTEKMGLSMFLAELSAGPWSKQQAFENGLGVLRVLFPYPRNQGTGISDKQYEIIKAIVADSRELLGRAEATHVVKLGAWQYEHAVSGLGQSTFRALERQSTLQALSDLMLELLGAGLCRVAVHDPETHRWRSGPISGRWWEGSCREIDIVDTNEGSAIVKTAKDGVPLPIANVQEDHRCLRPNDWVRGSLELPLIREGAKCDTVITLWHHVVDWFSQFDFSLLESLAAIGGARVQRVQAVELQTAKEIQTVSRHLAHTIKNYLPERPFVELSKQVPLALLPLANDCLRKVKKISSMRRRFLHLAKMNKFRSDGPHRADELYARLEGRLLEFAELFDLSVVHHNIQSFDELILCNRDFLEDDLMEFLHNSYAHAKDHVARRIELSFVLRIASPEDLAKSAVLAHSGDAEPYAVIEYCDNGPGIRDGEKEAIFVEKSQKGSEPETESMGLGLPLARTLVRKLGGDLVECGRWGEGVRFLTFFKTTT